MRPVRSAAMERTVTRRTLIGTGAAAGAAAMSPSAAQAAKKKPKRAKRPRKADVVVIGAGLAGLQAAHDVVAAGKSVFVLEARNRVGGRTLNHDSAAARSSRSAASGSGRHRPSSSRWPRTSGIDTFKTYNDGNYIYSPQRNQDPVRGQRRRSAPCRPTPRASPTRSARSCKLNQMAAEARRRSAVGRTRAPRNGTRQTFETWKLAQHGDRLRPLAAGPRDEAVWAAEPRDVSLLHYLFYIRAGHRRQPRHAGRLPAPDQHRRRCAGEPLRRRLAAGRRSSWPSSSGRARRSSTSPSAGSSSASAASRSCTDKARFTGKPGHRHRAARGDRLHRLPPPLPADRAQLLQRLPQGNAIKCEAVYDKPFWRDAGLAGQVISDAEPVRDHVRQLPARRHPPGSCSASSRASFARKWARKPADERRAAVLGELRDLLRRRGAQAPRLHRDGLVERGLDPRVLRRLHAARRPARLRRGDPPARSARLKWAGAETATLWNGYMDGALRSGSRAAADEALADL